MKSLAALLLAGASIMHAAPLFFDDFESGNLSQWSVSYTGVVATAPGGSNAVKFNGLGSGGDLWSGFIPYTLGTQLTLEFDFYQTSPNNQNSFIGTDHQIGSFGVEQWLMSSEPSHAHATYSGMDGLTPDTWHHITLDFTPYDPGSLGSLVLKLEQTGGTPGTAWFDNISLSQTPAPEPSTLSCLALGLCILPCIRRARRRSPR